MRAGAWAIGMLLLAAAMGDVAAAAEEMAAASAVEGWVVEPGESPAKDWEFEVAPYMWVAANFGTIDVLGRIVKVDLTAYDLLKAVFEGDALAGASYFGARWRRWSVFVDAFGGGAKSDQHVIVPVARCDLDLEAKVRLYQAIVDFGLGRELGRWSLAGRRRPITLGVYAGMRYMHLGSKIRSTAEVEELGLERRTEASTSFDWADPMIGVRWEVPLHDRVSLDFRGDIGGFGASSDLIWGLVGGVRYWMEWNPKGIRPWIGVGYRALAFDRSGSGGRAEVDLQYRGPVTALGVVF